MTEESRAETAERHEWLCRVVDHALELTEPERGLYLAEACPDGELRRQVDAMLAFDTEGRTATHSDPRDVFEHLESLMETKPGVTESGPGRAQSPGPFTAIGTRIGPYLLKEVLGEGGMGIVYLAEQTEPVERQVALKLVRSSLQSERAGRRFEAERQAMARLSHPNIAQIFEAGATPEGFPYFAMEFVPGEPLISYCDQRRLTLEKRIRLLLAVCRAVQHAHQRGIIHRDLKPSNILVAELDSVPHPKVIDFGISKALDQPLADRTATRLIGTPSYMSPESLLVGDEAVVVDTRSDIYALGIILFELLVGTRPFEAEGSSVAQLFRQITDVDAPRPSRRLAELSPERRDETANQRRLTPAALGRRLAGDLDWIVDKAIRRERDERYESTDAFADDLERFLADEPVAASPPSRLYLARKFAQRHRGAVALTSFALLLLIAFSITMVVQNRRISAALDSARQEAEARGLVSEFLKELFTTSDPSESRGQTVTARELLDRGAEKIEGTLEERPELQAELMLTIGETYRNLGLYSAAEPLLARSFAAHRDLLGEATEATQSARGTLANVLMEQGRFDEAETLYRQGLATSRSMPAKQNPQVLSWLFSLGALYAEQQRYAEAEPLLVEALAMAKQELAEDDLWYLACLSTLGTVYMRTGRFEAAEPLYREALEITRTALGEDHPRSLVAQNNLAVLYSDLGHYEQAENLFRQAIRTKERVVGAGHPSTLNSRKMLGRMYEKQERYGEAESILRRTFEAQEEALGEGHPSAVTTLYYLAQAIEGQGRLEEAEPLYREVVRVRSEALGENAGPTLEVMSALGELLVRLGCLAAAEGRPEEALEHLRRAAELGHRAAASILAEPCFDGLRTRAEFRALAIDE